MSPNVISRIYHFQQRIERGEGFVVEAFEMLERVRLICFTVGRQDGEASYCYCLLLEAMESHGWLWHDTGTPISCHST